MFDQYKNIAVNSQPLLVKCKDSMKLDTAAADAIALRRDPALDWVKLIEFTVNGATKVIVNKDDTAPDLIARLEQSRDSDVFWAGQHATAQGALGKSRG